MKKVTVIIENDLDNRTVVVNGDKKVRSTFMMTSEELTVPTSQLSQLIFRKADNSNALMFCTGYEKDGEWYGDRPSDGVWTNPFDGKDYERNDGVDSVYEEREFRFLAMLAFEEKDSGVLVKVQTAQSDEFSLDESDDFGGGLPPLKDVVYNGVSLGSPSTWTNPESMLFVWDTGIKVVSSTRTPSVELVFNNTKYEGKLKLISKKGEPKIYATGSDNLGDSFEMALREHLSGVY